MKPDLICVAFPAWEGNYVKSTVELMKRMAQDHRILYVDYQYTYKDLLMGLLGRGEAPVRRMLGLEPRLRKMPAQGNSFIWILTPPTVLPANFLKNPAWYDWVQRWNARRLKRSINQAQQQLQLQDPIVVNAFNPAFGNFLLDQLGEKRNVYYCFDEIAECDWVSNHGERVEKEFMPRVNATITTSQILQQTKKPWTPECFLVPNGVDYPLFEQGFVPVTDKPESVIGYIGTIDSRINYEILETIARDLPQSKLLLIGRLSFDKANVAPAIDRLKSYPNVQFVSAQPAEALPSYLKQVRVGLIPFVKNPQTAAIYPMKINEYLAAGVAVVSTDFAPLDDFGTTIAIADSLPEFMRNVTSFLQQDSVEEQRKRQTLAYENSWDRRAKHFSSILDTINS